MNILIRKNGIHLFLIAAFSLGIILLTSLGAIINPASAQDGKPTIVLVHGAFAESDSWKGVLTKLIAKGYPTIAAANPLRGVKSDADYVASILKSIKGPIVLVGHSYGGSVITNAVNDNKNVKALVYVAGFAPEMGETAADLSGRYPGSTLGPTLAPPVALPDGGKDLYIQQSKFHAQFAADVPVADAKLMASTQRPIMETAFNEASGAPAWKSTPSCVNLFSPLQLGPYPLPNRVVMAPMTRNRAGKGNVPTILNATYHAQRASAGLLITEATQVTPYGQGYPATPGYPFV
jgi:pimeloyl-ACP methyl ester carboxylesterase